MHVGPQYIHGILPASPTKADALSLRLSAANVEGLRQSLLADSNNYYYSAIVSFFDAFLGLDQRLFTWCTVQFYYCVFYCLRSLLALKGHCVFYVNEKPFACSDAIGSSARSCGGTTHKVVLGLFSEVFSGDPLLSQPIGGEPALTWLTNRREEANYRQGRFLDPEVPAHFVKVTELGFRRAVGAYLDDRSSLYVFDADHAIIAFPLALLLRARSELQSRNLQLQPEGSRFLAGLGRDKNGRIAGLERLL